MLWDSMVSDSPGTGKYVRMPHTCKKRNRKGRLPAHLPVKGGCRPGICRGQRPESNNLRLIKGIPRTNPSNPCPLRSVSNEQAASSSIRSDCLEHASDLQL